MHVIENWNNQKTIGNSLMVQWLGLQASTAGAPGFDPWLGN